ncbi:MAG TPA: hypothetical protein VD866_24415 [Urbifossiella sp.]|nr:hypothetical protein [Urbifossiella sp.]
MNRLEWRGAAESLIAHARAVRAGGTVDGWAMPDGPTPDPECATLRAAMVYLAAEVEVVRAGKASGLYVLDDELASTERALARL